MGRGSLPSLWRRCASMSSERGPGSRISNDLKNTCIRFSRDCVNWFTLVATLSGQYPARSPKREACRSQLRHLLRATQAPPAGNKSSPARRKQHAYDDQGHSNGWAYRSPCLAIAFLGKVAIVVEERRQH